MTQALNLFQPLTDEMRHAYLQAMDITHWVPKDQLAISVIPSFESESIQEQSDNSQPQNQIQVNQTVHDEHAEDRVLVQVQPENIADGVETVIEQIKTQETAQQVIVEQQAPINKSTQINSYLKLVNWKSSVNSGKSLLIICRHDRDQPAQSFAKANTPSQFMNDYLQALNDLLMVNGLELQMQLAHLTEAGLGSDAQPMPETVAKLAPDLILMLGDKSVHHLLSSESDVAENRGKLLDIKHLSGHSSCKAIVSYHPFTLIKNPPLKKLALEDLGFVVNVIKNLET